MDVFDPFDAEGISNHLYQLAQLDPALPRGAERIAQRLGIPVRRDAFRMLGLHAHTEGPDGPTIWVNPRASPAAQNYGCSHELIELTCRNVVTEHIELACDHAAAALVAPRTAFRRMLSAVGEDFPRLASAFVVDESCAVLRFGEVTGHPLVLVAPTGIRARGEEWGWPPEPELRRLVRARSLPSGLKRVALQDDRRRVALLAA